MFEKYDVSTKSELVALLQSMVNDHTVVDISVNCVTFNGESTGIKFTGRYDLWDNIKIAFLVEFKAILERRSKMREIHYFLRHLSIDNIVIYSRPEIDTTYEVMPDHGLEHATLLDSVIDCYTGAAPRYASKYYLCVNPTIYDLYAFFIPKIIMFEDREFMDKEYMDNAVYPKCFKSLGERQIYENATSRSDELEEIGKLSKVVAEFKIKPHNIKYHVYDFFRNCDLKVTEELLGDTEDSWLCYVITNLHTDSVDMYAMFELTTVDDAARFCDFVKYVVADMKSITIKKCYINNAIDYFVEERSTKCDDKFDEIVGTLKALIA